MESTKDIRTKQMENTIGSSTVKLKFEGKRLKHFLYFGRHAFNMLFKGITFIHYKLSNKEQT